MYLSVDKMTNLKAFIIGCLIILLTDTAWLIFSLTTEFFKNYFGFLIWVFPAIASFVVVFLAKSKKFLIAMSMALIAALLMGLTNFIYGLFGSVDFQGWIGFLTIVVISLILNIVPCFLASVIAYFICKKLDNKKKLINTKT